MAAATKPEYLRKSPGDIRNYYLDYGAMAEIAVDGETIASASITSTPSGLTIGSPVINGTKVVFLITGGTTNATYLITVSATTSTSKVLSRTAELRVETI